MSTQGAFTDYVKDEGMNILHWSKAALELLRSPIKQKQDLDWSLKTTLDQETEKVVGFETTRFVSLQREVGC